jgi:hypothetical protein
MKMKASGPRAKAVLLSLEKIIVLVRPLSCEAKSRAASFYTRRAVGRKLTNDEDAAMLGFDFDARNRGSCT